MGSGTPLILIIIGGWVLISLVYEAIKCVSDAMKYRRLKPQLDKVQSREEHLEERIKQENSTLEEERAAFKKHIERENNRIEAKGRETQKAIEKLYKQRSMGFPWLADAYADYFELKDKEREKMLTKKKHPAMAAALTVREIRTEKRELIKKNKVLEYQLTYVQKLFPWLKDLIVENENEIVPVKIKEGDSENISNDPVAKILTQEEYQSLSSVERNQLALDRYVQNRKKSKWAIGRDYEMYVGYLYKQKGYTVEYKGILDGFEDLGRDVIASNNKEVCIIQCKYWAQYKTIYEKHIFQLFGTTMEYWLANFTHKNTKPTFEEFTKAIQDQRLKPIFFTSTTLSDKAKEIAATLGIEVIEGEKMGEFPRIKCNINQDEFGNQTKIYHLPMDQQYDRTIIGNRPGEFYAFSAQEAEDAGFRRAFRHRF